MVLMFHLERCVWNFRSENIRGTNGVPRCVWNFRSENIRGTNGVPRCGWNLINMRREN
jgi:hypothetical protein